MDWSRWFEAPVLLFPLFSFSFFLLLLLLIRERKKSRKIVCRIDSWEVDDEHWWWWPSMMASSETVRGNERELEREWREREKKKEEEGGTKHVICGHSSFRHIYWRVYLLEGKKNSHFSKRERKSERKNEKERVKERRRKNCFTKDDSRRREWDSCSLFLPL